MNERFSSNEEIDNLLFSCCYILCDLIVYLVPELSGRSLEASVILVVQAVAVMGMISG